jgi:hypothetical protein
MLLHNINENEMKKKWVDFVEIVFHLNKNYIEWICIMQVELNVTQVNLNWIEIPKLKWLELNTISFSFRFNKINVPIEILIELDFIKLIKLNHIGFSWIQIGWIQFKLDSFKLIWIQPNYENSIMKKHMLICVLIYMSVDQWKKWGS